MTEMHAKPEKINSIYQQMNANFEKYGVVTMRQAEFFIDALTPKCYYKRNDIQLMDILAQKEDDWIMAEMQAGKSDDEKQEIEDTLINLRKEKVARLLYGKDKKRGVCMLLQQNIQNFQSGDSNISRYDFFKATGVGSKYINNTLEILEAITPERLINNNENFPQKIQAALEKNTATEDIFLIKGVVCTNKLLSRYANS